MIMIIKKKRKR
nr:ribosomal protein L22 [Cyanothamnus anemonifolius]